MRTGLLFDFVVDIVSQALAWIYLQDKMNDLRYGGLRGALQIRTLFDDRNSGDADVAAAASAAFTNAAVGAKMDAAAFENACRKIAEDPYTEFLPKCGSSVISWGAAVLHIGRDSGSPEGVATGGVGRVASAARRLIILNTSVRAIGFAVSARPCECSGTIAPFCRRQCPQR